MKKVHYDVAFHVYANDCLKMKIMQKIDTVSSNERKNAEFQFD